MAIMAVNTFVKVFSILLSHFINKNVKK